jgi:hypothetical protein
MVAVVIVASVVAVASLPAGAAAVLLNSPYFLPNDTHYSPWAYPLKYLQVNPGTHNYVWTMVRCIKGSIIRRVAEDRAVTNLQDALTTVKNVLESRH